MHRVAPAPLIPALLSPHLALPKIRKLPQVVYRVEAADLAEPSADALHHVLARLQPTPPVCLPFEEVAGTEGVCAELEDAAEGARGRGGPEGEFLHEVGAAGGEVLRELALKLPPGGGVGEAGMGLMIAGVWRVLVFLSY